MKQDCLGSAIKQPAEVNCFKVGQQAQPKGKENPDLLLLKKSIFTDAAGREEGEQGGALKGGWVGLKGGANLSVRSYGPFFPQVLS